MQSQAETKIARPRGRPRTRPEFIAAVRFSDGRPRTRPEFIAAVRYNDGRRELFAVKNADDLADARQLVLTELMDVAALVLAPRH